MLVKMKMKTQTMSFGSLLWLPRRTGYLGRLQMAVRLVEEGNFRLQAEVEGSGVVAVVAVVVALVVVAQVVVVVVVAVALAVALAAANGLAVALAAALPVAAAAVVVVEVFLPPAWGFEALPGTPGRPLMLMSK